MLNNNKNQNIKTLFFFSAKKVKRDFLYQSKEILQKKGIKLTKPSITIEKNIRKIRFLDNILKSSTLVGISDKELDFNQLKIFANIDIPGLDFLGVFSKNEYMSKNRLNIHLVSNSDVLFATYLSLAKMPQTLSNNLICITGLTSNYIKPLK